MQFIGNRKLMQRDTSLRATQLKRLGGHVPPPPIPSPVSHQQKLSFGRSWLVHKFADPTHPFFNIVQITVIVKTCHLKHGFPAESVFIKRDYFKTFMRWVAHNTSHSKLALQDGNTVCHQLPSRLSTRLTCSLNSKEEILITTLLEWSSSQPTLFTW